MLLPTGLFKIWTKQNKKSRSVLNIYIKCMLKNFMYMGQNHFIYLKKKSVLFLPKLSSVNGAQRWHFFFLSLFNYLLLMKWGKIVLYYVLILMWTFACVLTGLHCRTSAIISVNKCPSPVVYITVTAVTEWVALHLPASFSSCPPTRGIWKMFRLN